jgi:ATP adenylyltransferase
MTMPDILQRTREVTAAAKNSGALIPIDTDYCIVNDRGIDFVVRIARNLDRRKQPAAETPAAKDTQKPFNPFLPYEQALWVANTGINHVALLNKFNVIDNHLLIITKQYEHQDQLLTESDLVTITALIAQHGGLGFYNGGTVAGASQHHKHLQWIPGVELHGRICVPIETSMPPSTPGSWQLVTKPFPMALARFDADFDLASQCIDFYRGMTQRLGIDTGEINASRPYNLLITSSHMWIVPRAQECFESISLNALAFAGSLFVKNAEQLEILKKAGPLTALRGAAEL